MSNYLVKNILRLRERGFLQITKKTVVSLFPFFLFPFFLFSAIIGVISQSVFSEPGYINQFFSITDWFPIFRLLSQVCQTYPVF